MRRGWISDSGIEYRLDGAIARRSEAEKATVAAVEGEREEEVEGERVRRRR
jgi:hypothetical protein